MYKIKDGILNLSNVPVSDILKTDFCGKTSSFGHSGSLAVRVPEALEGQLKELHFNLWSQKTLPDGRSMPPVLDMRIFFEDGKSGNPRIEVVTTDKNVKSIKTREQYEELEFLNIDSISVKCKPFEWSKSYGTGYTTKVLGLIIYEGKMQDDDDFWVELENLPYMEKN